MVHFPTKISHFLFILEGLAIIEDVSTFLAIWQILLPFGILC
jgi:hypothetical protein